jgi:hypothetical protein
MAAKRRKSAPGARGKQRGGPQATRESPASGWNVLLAPIALAVGLLAISVTPRVQVNSTLTTSFWIAAGLLIAWSAMLLLASNGRDGPRSLETRIRPQHWVQALCQLAVFAYWGWFWRPVYDMAVLMAGQLAFAYAFDMLLSWSRRERYVLGFGPFPIIFSINLFLWFRDDWFFLQFLMIAVGFLGKELVRWTREGRRVHVFNPSAFSLGLFSLVLIATSSTDLTWGPEIASTLTLAPRIYTFLFLVGLVVMYFFSITLVAGFAATVLFAGSALYASLTGVPYFVDSEIPAAVFLGLHLLVTDPSTSPRTPGGKAVFGALYGVGVFALYSILGSVGAPTFYDKLLCVPLLNLSVRGIDGLMRSIRERGTLSRLRTGWSPARLNLAFMGVWAALFVAMTATGRTDGRHVGDSLPFWERACAEGRPTACDRLLQLEATYCRDSSAWACNELGAYYTEGAIVEADRGIATGYFARACELRFQPACLNLLDATEVARSTPRALDLRLMLREGGRNLMDLPEPDLYARACEHAWGFACGASAGAP